MRSSGKSTNHMWYSVSTMGCRLFATMGRTYCMLYNTLLSATMGKLCKLALLCRDYTLKYSQDKHENISFLPHKNTALKISP